MMCETICEINIIKYIPSTYSHILFYVNIKCEFCEMISFMSVHRYYLINNMNDLIFKKIMDVYLLKTGFQVTWIKKI